MGLKPLASWSTLRPPRNVGPAVPRPLTWEGTECVALCVAAAALGCWVPPSASWTPWWGSPRGARQAPDLPPARRPAVAGDSAAGRGPARTRPGPRYRRVRCLSIFHNRDFGRSNFRARAMPRIGLDEERSSSTASIGSSARRRACWSAGDSRLLACRGPDAATYVHDQLTNDVEALEPGAGLLRRAARPQGADAGRPAGPADRRRRAPDRLRRRRPARRWGPISACTASAARSSSRTSPRATASSP